MNDELLYNKIYEKTKDCGRTQFVRLLMDKERENKQLKEKLEASEKARKESIELVKENKQLKEQVKYLRRSIERKESTITELEQEKVPYTNEYVEKLEKVLKEAIELIKEKQRKDEFLELNEWQTRDLLSILDIDKGE